MGGKEEDKNRKSRDRREKGWRSDGRNNGEGCLK